MYINDNTKEQLSYYNLKSNNPDKSLPQDGTEVIMDVWFLIHTTPRPTYDQYTETTQEIEPIKTGEIYNQTWEVVALDSEEIDTILIQTQSSKVKEIWSFANNNITSYENGLIGDGNTQKSKTLSHDNDQRTTKRIDSIALSPEEDIAQAEYVDYTGFCADTNTAANTQEVTVQGMTQAEDVNNIIVDDGSYPVVPWSAMSEAVRQTLIDELVSQSTLPFGDYEELDRTGMNNFITYGDKYTMTGVYDSMPGGRQVYEVVGQDELASINIGWVITEHQKQDTYFDTVDGVFKK